MEEDEAKIKERLTVMINCMAKLLPEPTKVTSDLWKFAKMHDRRSYQLIRFCLAPESDYRTMYKAIVGDYFILQVMTSLLILFSYRKSLQNVLRRQLLLLQVSWKR